MYRSIHNFISRFEIPPWVIFLLACQCLWLPGCATNRATVQQVEQQTSDQQLIDQVMEALKTTEARLAKAKANNVDVYAPRQLDRAESALNEARRYAERFQEDPDLVNKSIALFAGDSMGKDALDLIVKANNALTQAEENKLQADAIFVEVEQNFVWLNKFQANGYFRYEYQDLKRLQQQLVDYVANDDLQTAQQRLPRLLAEQRALEIVAAQRFYLYDLTQRIEREDRHTLERFAAISYGTALGALNRAKSVVAQNPRDEARILDAKANADFAYGMANAVASDIQKLEQMDRQAMERWLILLVTKLNDVGKAIGSQDVRNHEIQQQLDLLADAVASRNDGSVVAGPEPMEQPASAPVSEEQMADVTEEQAINHRVTQLEQSLSEQIKALSEQINAMKDLSISANVAPTPEVVAPNN